MSSTPPLLTASEVAAQLDVSPQQIAALAKQGILTRVDGQGRRNITRLSVEFRKSHRAFKRMSQGKDGDKPLSQGDKRAIVQTLLLSGVITPKDFASIQAARLEAALKRVRT